ncbi:MAG TPA: hypothetical protein VGF28_07305 [Thermoanaerobaculia bacterium]|jgi:hypothetical protein
MNNRILRAAALAAAITLLLPSTLDAAPTFKPNSIKYSDRGLPNATGRAGGASMEARALLGKDGRTDLEVTASGTLRKVQLKAAGETSNFHDVGSRRFRTTLERLIRHDKLQVQTNVDAGKRTGVITVQEQVKLRPDVAVDQLLLPAQAAPGVPTNITANIRELNGDVGARANCVLRVNGTTVDQASSIWVDAGSTVNCAFLYTFPKAGTWNVAVDVTGVAPADWDTANNSKAGSVKAGPASFSTWTSWAKQEFTRTESTTTSQSSRSEMTRDGWRTNLRFDAVIPTAVDTRTFGMAVAEKTDGRPIVDVRREEWGWGADDECTWLWGRSQFGSACVKNGVTNVSYVRNAAYAVYLSREWGRTTNPDGTVTEHLYFEYESEEQPFGRQVRYGNTVQLDVVASDGDGSWEASSHIFLAPYDNGIDESTACYPWGSCTHTRTHVWGTEGRDASHD